MTKKIKKVVIPAAGWGTRSLPASKVVPKELLPIVDKPTIQYIVEEAIAAGMEEVIFVISKGKESVVNHFRPLTELETVLRKKGDVASLHSITELNDKVKYSIVYQNEPLGLGHAVLCAREAVARGAVGDEWFFVFLPDDLIDHEVPCAVQMMRAWEVMPQGHEGSLVAVMEVPWEEVSYYGVVKALPMTASLGKIENVVEKPKREEAPSNLAIVGRYLLPPKIFNLLEKVKPGAIGEIQLTDALLELARDKGLYAFQFEGERFDMGDKKGFVEANINFALKHPLVKDNTWELIKLLAESR